MPITGNDSKSTRTTNTASSVQKLGTFGGVFTPSLLTILGVIMYLRFGWVVGNVGLIGTLIIVTLSTSITFLTALSIASIATDTQVKTGGAYYMISRSLGIEVGGAVGIPLFIAQALSVALYVIGFAESIVNVFPSLDMKLVGCGVTVAIGLLALFSTQATIRTQYFILAAIAISLISLVMGKPLEATHVELWGAPPQVSEGFWRVFAVFFPAVTGIMAGVNLSGDLRNPAKSIPKGTFFAVGTGYLIYMALPIILAGRADAGTLIDDPLIMRRISYWGNGILLGVWGATLSSAVGSILGAPRILQALAKDGVLPHSFRWLGRENGPSNIPRAGTIFTMILAIIAVILGDLDLIAPILTMFFLTTYGVLNIAAGVERLLGSPSFRPSFRVHWFFSLLGALGCIAVMFLINPLATLIAILFVAVIFVWLKRRGLRTAWGDVRRGLWMALTRTALLSIDHTPDPKNWRPHLLVLSGAPTRRWHLIELAYAITQGKSLLTVATVLKANDVTFDRIKSLESNIRDYLEGRGVESFVRVTADEDPFVGSTRLIQTYGLGALVPNTIVLGDTRELTHHGPYCEMIQRFHQAQRNVVIVRDEEKEGFGNKKAIDVWWGGLRKNGALMMILAYLISGSRDWRSVKVTIKMAVSTQAAAQDAEANLREIIQNMRIPFQHQVLVNEQESFWSLLKQESHSADLIMLGLAEPDENFLAYYEQLSERTQGLPATLFVLAAQEIAFEEILL
uniref:Na-K-Cl cotransporter n=1 Tax=Roseihalotalea indica TaxID=2867963 RepID=A0AA49GNK8_9BACT|nr:Na-K-Cl cotransporter [Tunicatimonas sp. TK19036]